jgi:hypothetical protein
MLKIDKKNKKNTEQIIKKSWYESLIFNSKKAMKKTFLSLIFLCILMIVSFFASEYEY